MRCCPKTRGGIYFRNIGRVGTMGWILGEKKPLCRHKNSVTDGTISAAEDDPPRIGGTAGSTLHPQIPTESIIILNYVPAHTVSNHIYHIIYKNGTAANRKRDDLEMLSHFSSDVGELERSVSRMDIFIYLLVSFQVAVRKTTTLLMLAARNKHTSVCFFWFWLHCFKDSRLGPRYPTTSNASDKKWKHFRPH